MFSSEQVKAARIRREKKNNGNKVVKEVKSRIVRINYYAILITGLISPFAYMFVKAIVILNSIPK